MNEGARLHEPYKNSQQLYTMHFMFAFSSRMWQFGIVLFMAYLTNNSLFFVAMAGFASCLMLSLTAPSIGRALDRTDRLVAVRNTLIVKGVSVIAGYVLCGVLARTKHGDDAVDPHKYPSIYAIPILCAIAQVAFSAVPLCVEKDWIVVLSDGDSSWLSSTNSTLRQIDLACKSFAPAITGFIFSSFTQPQDAVILLVTNTGAVVLLYAFLRDVYLSWEPLSRRKGFNDFDFPDDKGDAGANMEIAASSSSSADATAKERSKTSIMMFLQSGVALPMISYSFLYLTVLSFGSIMIVYLRYRGMTDHNIGIHSGISALFGFAGSKAYPILAKNWGIWLTALRSIWFQCVLVAIASATFWFSESMASTYILCYCVILSRSGLWLFDLSVSQIVQETLSESIRGSVNGTWRSLYAMFDMMAFVFTMCFSDPNEFMVLCFVSALMVFCATASFTVAYIMHTSGHDGVLCGVGLRSTEYELIPDSRIDA